MVDDDDDDRRPFEAIYTVYFIYNTRRPSLAPTTTTMQTRSEKGAESPPQMMTC